MVMFDLPTLTKKDRKRYRWLARHLDAESYVRIQYSVYAKVFNSFESANHGKKRLKDFLKTNVKKGNVRIVMFTDAQFGKMEIVVGEVSTQEEITQPNLFDF
ncbi:CRISPR-associated endonuclease Cas2 [Hydrogenimonas sp.]